MADTVLVISGQGMPPFAIRGIKEKLDPIDQAKNMRRTVNGVMKNVAAAQFRGKYRIHLNCTDMDSPAFDALKVGDEVTISCITELCYLTAGGSPAKTVVSGSSRVDGAYTWYRPEIPMTITGKSQDTGEWEATAGWTLDAEET